jgi:hypothetical protein
VPYEPCCIIKDRVFIFFYVDDIIFGYPKNKEHLAYSIIQDLQTKYTLTGGEDLKWFLGVEITQDRRNHTLLLSQAAYIKKISRLINKKDTRHDTLMSSIELELQAGLATLSEINKHQRKVSLLLFAAVTTRLDIAFATSRLAQYMLNLGLKHHEAAD